MKTVFIIIGIAVVIYAIYYFTRPAVVVPVRTPVTPLVLVKATPVIAQHFVPLGVIR